MNIAYNPDKMVLKYGEKNNYSSPKTKISFFSRHFPSLAFYLKLVFGPGIWICNRAKNNMCDDIAWIYSSAWCAEVLESVGGYIEIINKHFFEKPGPYVIIANHMSTLETFLLPALLRPYGPLTFVVKKSLVSVPFFGAVMRSRNPVVVGRKNPREDLAIVLKEGINRLKQGISIVVFPQSTRTLHFSRDNFNSIGIKLAAKAGVAAIPLALKTDVWGASAKIKELGKIRPDLPARFKFGAPVFIEGNGKKEHENICQFIENTLKSWQKEDGINN